MTNAAVFKVRPVQTLGSSPRVVVVQNRPSRWAPADAVIRTPLQDDAFDLDAYLASIMSLDETSATPSAQDIFTTAVPLLDELESAKENLHALADATSRRLATLAREAKDEEVAFLSRVDHLRDGVGGLNATLRALETRVVHVVRSTSGVGDRLRLADARRAAAEEARALATHLVAFDRAQDFQALPHVVDPLFHDPARSAEAARLAQRLLRLAHDAVAEDRAEMGRARAQTHPSASATRASRGVDPDPSSSSRASRPPRLAVAAHNLERYCDALENRLLSSFESAERARDAEGARAAARTLAGARASRDDSWRRARCSCPSRATPRSRRSARRRRSAPRWRRRRKRTPPPSPRSTLYGAFSRERGTPPAPRRRRRGNSSRIIASPPRRSPRASSNSASARRWTR